MNNSPKLFPLGTSRLHWAAEYITRHKAAEVIFPCFGYFQSPGQIATMLEILSGAREVPEVCQYLTRRDGTPFHPFDNRSLTPDPALWAEKRAEFASADVILLEFSSPVEFRLGDLHVQGNPNYLREVSFADVWKDGYYAIYEPEVEVERYRDSDDEVAAHFTRCAEALKGRPVVVQSHIYRGEQGFGRKEFADTVSRLAADNGWDFIDAAALCEMHGFRFFANGTTDIHHLSWPGTRTNAVQLVERSFTALGLSMNEVAKADILGDPHEMM
jgi:hypothetical protein